MSSFTEVEKMRLSQKISKKNTSKDNKGKLIFNHSIYRWSKIFIETYDEWYEKKFGFYW